MKLAIRPRSWFRNASPVLVILACLLALLLTTTTASAASVRWKKTTIPETSGAWKIDLDIHLNKPPSIAHVPMKFSFMAVALYERSLVDGKSEPQLTKLPLINQQPIIESVDVGFLDPGTGKIQARTRFNFHITRDHGFEAGEYEVTVKASGDTIGGKSVITLEGQNEVVDRRSMVFEANEKPKPVEKPKESTEDDKKPGTEDDAYWAGGPKEAPPDGDAEVPPPIQNRPGACGCRMIGHPRDASLGGLGLLAMAALLRRLSRARRESSQ